MVPNASPAPITPRRSRSPTQGVRPRVGGEAGFDLSHFWCANRYPESMPNVGPWEVFLLLLLALLLFGAKRLPEIGRSMGKGFREFKDSVAGKVDDDDDDVPELPAATMNDATTKTEEPVVARERE